MAWVHLSAKDRRGRYRQWGIAFLAATLLGLLNFGVNVADELANNEDTNWDYYLVNELSGAYTFIVLLPALVWFFRRVPLQGGKRLPNFFIYLVVTILFGLAHTTLMFITRVYLYDWFGFKPYEEMYGILRYRIVMEYFKQFLFFWLFYGGYRFVQKTRESQQQQIRAARLEQQLSQAQLQTLQMQLNPHFLFNTLNMISSLMYEDPEKADQMIANLSEMLRISLQKNIQMEHTVAQEITLLEKYLSIIKVRFGDRLKIRMQIEEGILNARIPVFLLQPIVENAVKHGSGQAGQTEIVVLAKQAGENLQLMVIDNGPGLTHPSKWGVGINNTIERLEKRYGDDYNFSLTNQEEGGVTTFLQIPYLKEEDLSHV